MISKEEVNIIIKKNNGAIYSMINNMNDSSSLVNFLKNIGRLPPAFDGKWLIDLLNHKNKNVRFWAVKNIGKLKNSDYLTDLKKSFYEENVSEIKREIVSSVGRLKSEKAISTLLTFLNDNDPKIQVQAIRALLYFKGQKNIDKKLKKLKNHENEIISNVIKKEYDLTNELQQTSHHTFVPEFLKNTVVNSDVREVLKIIPNDIFHLTFTSPPYYNARDYSIYSSYKFYLDFLGDVFKSIFDKTKEGRFLIVNTSPVIIPRVSRQHSSTRYPIPFDLHNYITDIGWEFIDEIIWVKPEATSKNRIGGFMQHRKPLAYKPNAITEYIMVYRKKTSKLLDWNIKQYSKDIIESSKIHNDVDTNNVWHINPKYDKVHSAVFPVELCKRIIKYYSYKGDLVFDPFAGSGTFGRTAKSMSRYFFLTEQEKKYFEYMKSMVTKNQLFNEKQTNFYNLEQFKNIINDFNTRSNKKDN